MNSMKYTMLIVLLCFSSLLMGMHNKHVGELSRNEVTDLLLVSLCEKNIEDLQKAIDSGANPLDAAFHITKLEEAEFDARLREIVLVLQQSIVKKKLDQDKVWIDLCEKIGKFSDQRLAEQLFIRTNRHTQKTQSKNTRFTRFGEKEEPESDDDEEITVQSSSFVNQPLVGFAVGFLGFFLLYLLFKHQDMPKTELTV